MALLWKRQLSNSSTYFVFSRQFKSSTNQNVNKNGGSCKWWWSSYLSQNSRMRRAACLLLGGTAAGISCYWWCLQRPRPPWYLKIRSATGILLAPPTVHAKSKVNLVSHILSLIIVQQFFFLWGQPIHQVLANIRSQLFYCHPFILSSELL